MTIKLHYLSPKEWAEIRKTEVDLGTVVLLEGLPWRMRLFTYIREFEDLGYGVKIGQAKDFSVITANSCKLFSIRKYDEFCAYLARRTGKQVKPAGTVLPSLFRNMAVVSFFVALKNIPIMAVVELLLLAWLLWED